MRTIWYDNRMDAYQSFMQDKFPATAVEISEEFVSEELKLAVIDLIAEWRNISYAATLPAILPQSIADFQSGFIDNKNSFSSYFRFSSAIMTKLSESIPEVTSDPYLRDRLKNQIHKISQQINVAKNQGSSAVKELHDRKYYWEEFLKIKPFTMGLHATMRLSWVAIFTAYEDFLVRSASIKLQESLRSNSKGFPAK